jgi:hypothetical protein
MRKTKFLFIFLLLVNIQTNAQQQYQRCLDDGMVRWSILDYHVSDAGLVSTEMIAWGDTVISGLSYKNLYYGEIDIFGEENNEGWKNYIPAWQWEEGDYYIRESDDASKLYLYNDQENKEYVISDISLQKGDEFHFLNQDYIVDSVYIWDDRKHIRMDKEIFSPVGGNDTLIFIEGVGPNVWDWQIYPMHTGSLNCFQNRTSFYKYEKTGCLCGYYSLGGAIESVYNNKNYNLIIQKDEIKIFFLSDEAVEISLHDMHGRLYYAGRRNGQPEISIPAARYPKGIYLLKILNTNQLNINKIIL